MSDIFLLRLFLSIADHGSIAAGARACDIPPSVASRRLIRLESNFHAKLIQRSTRSLVLTEAGRIFLERARTIVARYDQLADQLAFEQGRLSGHIRIASNDFMGHLLLPTLLSHFREQHRQLTFSMTLTDEPLRLLKGECDLAIHAGSSPGGALIGRPVHSYKRVICASPDYIARNGGPTSPAHLEHHDCVVHPHNDRRVWHFRTPNGSHHAQSIDPVIEVNSYPAIVNFAKQGLGIIRIARVMTDLHVAEGTLQILMPDYRCVEPDGTDPAIWLTYPDRGLLSRVRLVADHLYDLMRKVVSQPSWTAAMENSANAPTAALVNQLDSLGNDTVPQHSNLLEL